MSPNKIVALMVGAFAIFCAVLAAYVWTRSASFETACFAAGGDRVERLTYNGLQCWDTKAGRRIFLQEQP
jgi:hypothetical protein